MKILYHIDLLLISKFWLSKVLEFTKISNRNIKVTCPAFNFTWDEPGHEKSTGEYFTFCKGMSRDSFAAQKSGQSVGLVETLLPAAITRCCFALSCRFSTLTHLNYPLILNHLTTQRAIRRQGWSQLALNGAEVRFYTRQAAIAFRRTSCSAINFE